ncbi:hypothetical protein EGM87_16005 [Sphingobium sp. RSMS]|uniref:hypothetical protein n=1 Tax=Sphingobium sp. RSMS TaxID=520734 RepID=UPI0010F8D344|nr:hypothetical protein [Sphingobium sp. RSMS]UXC90516.1 hypothetical protein EGM87_16005 [Sphingobium sp. RSMS]
MTTQPATATQAQTLMFKEHPIRIVIVDEVPWFSLEDVTEALGYTQLSAKRAFHSSFPEHARMECLEETGEGQKATTVLSPVGVWHFTAILDAYRGQHLANWAKKEALRLHPNPMPKDPRFFLTLTAEGQLPPTPAKYSGRLGEWRELKDSEEYRQFRFGLHPSQPSRAERQARLIAEAEAARLEANA